MGVRTGSKRGAWPLLLAGVLIAGCATRSPTPTTPDPTPPAAPSQDHDAGATPAAPPATPPAGGRVGGDRDAHGCIGSAGYSWCARENQCVRPWELARTQGITFGSDAEANRQAIER